MLCAGTERRWWLLTTAPVWVECCDNSAVHWYTALTMGRPASPAPPGGKGWRRMFLTSLFAGDHHVFVPALLGDPGDTPESQARRILPCYIHVVPRGLLQHSPTTWTPKTYSHNPERRAAPWCPPSHRLCSTVNCASHTFCTKILVDKDRGF